MIQIKNKKILFNNVIEVEQSLFKDNRINKKSKNNKINKLILIVIF